jgi:hypothetical protein
MNSELILLTKSEAGIRARICQRSLEKLIATGRGPTLTKIGGKVLIRGDHLDAWIRSLADTSAAA